MYFPENSRMLLEAALGKKGYPVFPVVSDFLSQFGGSTITYNYRPLIHLPYLGLPDSRTYECHFDAAKTICHTSRIKVEAVASHLEIPSCPIGGFYYDGAPLMMAPDRVVYTDVDELEVQIVGLSGREAVESILTFRPLMPISAVAELMYNEN